MLHKHGIKPMIKIKKLKITFFVVTYHWLHPILLTRKVDTTMFATFKMVDVISKCGDSRRKQYDEQRLPKI